MEEAGHDISWMRHSLAGPMLRFCLLPGLSMDPSRGPPELVPLLPPIPTLTDPVLPLVLLERSRFERLLVWCGVALLRPLLQRMVYRMEVERAQLELGSAALDFAFQPLESADDPTVVHALTAPLIDATGAVPLYGQALIAQAIAAASEPVAVRARMMLPEDVMQTMALYLPPALCAPAAACMHARSVLQRMDPAWLQSFPTIH